MLKKFSLRKICLATLLFLVAIILYSYPDELQTTDSKIDDTKKEIFLMDKNNYIGMTSMKSESKNINDRIVEIVYSLTKNSKYSNNIPKDFKPLIPEGTELIDYSLDKNGLLKLNFNQAFLSVSSETEEKMLEALIYSLTSLKEVKKIMIFIEGKNLTELPNSKKKLDLYLDRNYGINKIYDITTINNTKMVTVYYFNKTDNNYYIPISYITNDENDKVEIIIKNLKTNIVGNGNLRSHLDYQLQLMNYELDKDSINMNFNEILLNSVYDSKLKEEVKYSIYYSLKDTLGIKAVSFSVNSKKIDYLTLENS